MSTKNRSDRLKVMIAGVGGASLGTEILKCLLLAHHYDVFGCDISPTAYGLYDHGFTETFIVKEDRYVESVIGACREADVHWIIPGGEQPMALLGDASDQLSIKGINLVANHPEIIRTFSDKSATFKCLEDLGFIIPRTVEVFSDDDLYEIDMPCIIKPSTSSGGSAMVFFASDVQEARTYSDYVRRTGNPPLAQEYITPDEGEFTIGVLSWPDGELAGSIALKRALDAKLSVLTRSKGGIISSGYSQGYIGDFPKIRSQAESIAAAIGSRGPINVQGRVRNGSLIPFEINPRFSASTYLRAMAGFNEIDMFLNYLQTGKKVQTVSVREGWYLRSLTEKYIPSQKVLH